MARPKVAGILQPGYLPWLGFFEQMLYSDVFVLYDDVQYDKNGWRNRNRLKGPDGPVWLTVPVRVKGQPAINQVEIDPNQRKWAKKHLGTIRQLYAKAPYLGEYLPALEETLGRPWRKLLDLDLELIRLLAGWLELDTPLILSSELGVSHPDPTARLVRMLQKIGAGVFYEGASGRDYLDLDQFERAGQKVMFQNYQPRPYPQLHGEWEPFLSVLDLLLNCGPDSREYLAGAQAPPLESRS